VRARYAYDPFGRRTKVSGDMDADIGFAGMFWSSEANLSLTHFRAYDPNLGRWLSRDPLGSAELRQGPNLYAYVQNNPVNHVDPSGLVISTPELCFREPGLCAAITGTAASAVVLTEEAGGPEAVGENVVSAGEGCIAMADTLAASPIVQQVTQASVPIIRVVEKADRILSAPDYDFVGLNYQLPDTIWTDLEGNIVSEEEADFLRENLGWSQLYWRAAINDLVQFGPTAGTQAHRDAIDQLMSLTGLIRGSVIP
jgi:RHS repeat-associated protein